MFQRRDPSENSLAWFMLRHGPLIPRPDPQPHDSSSKSKQRTTADWITALLPAGVVPLDFDLESEVYNFAMNYDSISYIQEAYWVPTRPGPRTNSEWQLQMFLYNYLWRDVDIAFNRAPDLPYYIGVAMKTAGEIVSIRKRSLDSSRDSDAKVAFLELKTPSSLNPTEFRALCSQQPSSANNHNKRILCQLHKCFKNLRVTWGAISNGISTVFIRYEPNTKVFAMSDIIPHEHPAIIGFYCYWAKLADSQQLDHPRRSLLTLAVRINNDDATAKRDFDQRSISNVGHSDLTTGTSKIEEGPLIKISLDWPLMSYGKFAQVNPALLVCQTGEVPIVVKLSHGTRASNVGVQKEIENYESLRDLWGSVLPQIYGMGKVIEDGQESGTYCIAMERLEKVENWNPPKRKVEAKELLRQLHRRGFVHASVAERNFAWRSDREEVVIIDLERSYRGKDEEMENELRDVERIGRDAGGN